ncbi:hypothetical protein Fleli_0621 [Bernardetia litoralis DSM 6794]|uniref:SGNH/GDSL hydrolase family protein n=1 Tax=Bernardetia litoralis (strain ATCC 23117 / DSM 6794 / NBRC 15988 / NCIMB 1366 / Fx l1 / Sio-4) TaxID=880071 RepID=I4AGK0_BERLS|nr:hypothetical protein [Bernardetia litoralis]AFM03085.1 hypothetical protein Fleli_0621 [Bernardetia litoralis DSM 6794]
MMFKKIFPSLFFFFLSIFIWAIQYGFDLIIGDADGKIKVWDIYVFIGFIQIFLMLCALLWIPEVLRRFRGNFSATYEELLKRNSVSVLICFILFFFMCIDLIGSIFFNEREIERVHTASYYRTQHPCFHHGLVHNMASEAFWGDIKYPLYTNSFAFRDSAAFEAKQNLDKKQIVFIGDSFTEGVGVAYENTFFGRMRKEFSNNTEIELWNAGCVSYSPLIYYNKIKYYTEVENLKIDYLWVFIDATDVQDELNYKDFRPNCNQKYLPKAGMADSYRYKMIEDNSLFDIYKNHSLFVRLISNTYINFFTDLSADKKMYYYNNRFAWLDNEEIYQEWGKEGVKLAQNNMQSLVELCKEKNIKLAIVVYPWPIMLNNYDKLSSFIRLFMNFDYIFVVNLLILFQIVLVFA